jgi:hypothetical protein
MIVARPTQGRLRITSRNAVGETTKTTTEHVTLSRAPDAEVIDARYDEVRTEDTPVASRLSKAETRLVLRLRLRKTDGAAITRLRSEESVYSRGKWKKVGRRDLPLTHEAVRWQMDLPAPQETNTRAQREVEQTRVVSRPDTRKTFDIDLGRASAALSRRLHITCLDELGREQGSGEVTLTPIEESFSLSPDVMEAFGRLARITAAPLEVDIEHYARVLNRRADQMVNAAETRMESGIQGQAPRQNTKPQTS